MLLLLIVKHLLFSLYFHSNWCKILDAFAYRMCSFFSISILYLSPSLLSWLFIFLPIFPLQSFSESLPLFCFHIVSFSFCCHFCLLIFSLSDFFPSSTRVSIITSHPVLPLHFLFLLILFLSKFVCSPHFAPSLSPFLPLPFLTITLNLNHLISFVEFLFCYWMKVPFMPYVLPNNYGIKTQAMLN